MKFSLELSIFLLMPLATLQISSPDSLSYIGAVVEYNPVVSSKNGKKAADINADSYLKFIEKAADYTADILVFPESSLSIKTAYTRSEVASYIPNPEDKITPCDDNNEKYNYPIKTISCAARKYQIYVVINHMEKVECNETDCPDDGYLIYNTNVAFDRNGQVIARYRKYNLYGEMGTNITAEPEMTTFTTDFGVKFGTFICFDILFQTPTLNLTRDLGITDIIYSAHWFSELPHLFAVQAQSAWAYANDVNLLAAGYNQPWTSSSGTGIYIGQKGYINVISESKPSNVLVVAEIPKMINGKRSLSINAEKLKIYNFSKSEMTTTETPGPDKYLYKTEDLTIYTTELIHHKQNLHEKTLCDRDLCCEFKLAIDFNENVITNGSNYYRYRFAVFNGTRSFNVATAGAKVCGIIACVNDTLDGCAHLINPDQTLVSPITFKSIDISMKNVSNQNFFIMPTNLLKDMIPLNASDFYYKSVNIDGLSSYSMSLTKPRNDLLTFALFGRNFALDGTEITTSYSTKIINSPLLLIVTIICILFVLPNYG